MDKPVPQETLNLEDSTKSRYLGLKPSALSIHDFPTDFFKPRTDFNADWGKKDEGGAYKDVLTSKEGGQGSDPSE